MDASHLGYQQKNAIASIENSKAIFRLCKNRRSESLLVDSLGLKGFLVDNEGCNAGKDGFSYTIIVFTVLPSEGGGFSQFLLQF